MSRPEIWVREGRDLTITTIPERQVASLRLTDAKGEVTIRHELTVKDLRSLRRWLSKVLK